MFITRTGDEEAFIDARRCLRNVTPANGFFVFLRACDALRGAAMPAVFSRHARQNLPAGLLINTVEILPVCRVRHFAQSRARIVRKGRHALR
ncbi:MULTISPECIES: hypothetical protein [unclassified Bradyrhizobium]|uniref:hypothetical protein n=1 Tax=unclassified Bradyrhizobium TaxID=2631580 RepID=UPI0028E9A848|nr:MULTISPECIES: hypothetical protein [unclassified Bradyrhizobium]